MQLATSSPLGRMIANLYSNSCKLVRRYIRYVKSDFVSWPPAPPRIAAGGGGAIGRLLSQRQSPHGAPPRRRGAACQIKKGYKTKLTIKSVKDHKNAKISAMSIRRPHRGQQAVRVPPAPPSVPPAWDSGGAARGGGSPWGSPRGSPPP